MKNNLAFILSTGRTGTQFFEAYISQTSENSVCLHEPKPSRRFKFLSNLFLQGKASEKFICNIFKMSRNRLFHKIVDKNYVESSNFIFGCIPALNTCQPDIAILHIVRDPVSYCNSHLNHGFWQGFKKFTAQNVPYWLEKSKLTSDQKNDPINILFERWAYVNKQIESYASSNKYLLIRFEDLFSKDKELSLKTLNTIRNFLDLGDLSDEENLKWLHVKKNKSARKQQKYTITEKHLSLFTNNNKELLSKYNYSISLKK